MATPVTLLQLSPTMTTGTVVKWLVKEGQAVKSGTVLAEIETDKAVMEQESFSAGTVRKLVVPNGGQVPVGGTIAIIGAPDEDISALLAASNGAPKPAAAPGPPASPRANTTPAAPSPAPSHVAPAAPPSAGRKFVSPLARKIAGDSGVDVSALAGSGPGGRVIKRDVETALASPAAASKRSFAPIAPDEEIPLSQMRRVIATRLVQSRQQVPSFNLTMSFDAERLLAAVARIKELHPDAKVTVTHFLIRATASCAMRHPWIRTQYVNDKLIRRNSAPISVAVAIEDGLLTPVIRDAQAKGVIQIAAELRELAAKARARKLSAEDLSGGIQTISNLGMFGIDHFDAIINPPESTILAVGRVEEKPVVRAGAILPGKVMTITMGCDHRVVDGAVGAEFLRDLKASLEDPALMVL